MDISSVLGYALLGLVSQQPLSGYDVKKMFASTPMAGFSDSPGAIYPALGRLEKAGLVRSEVKQMAGLRQRRVFRITPKGLASLKAWMVKPISEEDVVRRVAELMLRFAFMDLTLGAERSVEFLREFAERLEAHIPSLHEYLEANAGAMPVSGRLALELGVEEYEARLEWAKKAIAHYRRRKKEL
jgi:PadR family transcriptional regulator, phenolic acid-responsive transcriptional regulator